MPGLLQVVLHILKGLIYIKHCGFGATAGSLLAERIVVLEIEWDHSTSRWWDNNSIPSIWGGLCSLPMTLDQC